MEGFFAYCLVVSGDRRTRSRLYGRHVAFVDYSEIAIAVVEAVLLVAFAIPLWAARVDHVPSASEALIVQVTGEQFAWNVHYPPDGYSAARTSSCSTSNRTRSDSIATMPPPKTTSDLNQLYLPVNKPASSGSEARTSSTASACRSCA